MKKIILTLLAVVIVGACSDSLHKDLLDLESTPEAHIARSNTGLAAWQIGIKPGTVAYSRNTSEGSEYNPRNWIAVTDETCMGAGIPRSLMEDCPLVGQVLGITEVRFYNTGIIADTTILLLDTYLVSGAPDSEKQSVYTHEIGHSLGMKHTATTDYIMYPTTAGDDTPDEDEIAILKEMYLGIPSLFESTDFFEYTSIYLIIQPSVPSYALYHPDMGEHTGSIIEIPEGDALKGPVTTVRHYYFSDGSTMSEIIDQAEF